VEIDARSQRQEGAATVGAELRISGVTTAEFFAKRSTVEFAPSAAFLDTSLKETFDRTITDLGASLRHRLTPLTTLTIAADAADERFVFAPVRNSKSLRVMPGFEFDPSALVSGKAAVGFRSFTAESPAMPDFNGVVASVELAYTLLGATRFSVQFDRDVQYSYQELEPYYLLSEIGAGVTQRVSDSLGITARVGRWRMDFSGLMSDRAPDDAEGPGAAAVSRVDTAVFFGGGLLRKISPDMRINVNVDAYHRSSLLLFRNLTGVRAGCSVAYTF